MYKKLAPTGAAEAELVLNHSLCVEVALNLCS